MRRALITGITGQDGSYLAEFLLQKGYEVHGIIRRVALEDPLNRMWRIQPIADRIQLHVAALESQPSLMGLLTQVQPDEVYHLAGHSFVGGSFEEELSTLTVNITTTHTVLSSVRETCPAARVYFAGSSEMFGGAAECPQRETTPFHPRSAYGISKCAGYYLTCHYREAGGLFTVTGILFNHESARRGAEFVTRKITRAATRIKLGLQETLSLGNLEAKRDWGYAPEYVEAMWRMLQAQAPDDYVIATGEFHSVQEFVEEAFSVLGLDWRDYVMQDPRYLRPREIDHLIGDASKASRQLGWRPKTTFQALVRLMVEADLGLAEREARMPPAVKPPLRGVASQ